MSQAIDTSIYKMKSSTSKIPSYRMKSNQFGNITNLYEADGINYQQEEWLVTFIPMEADSATAINLESYLYNSISNFLLVTMPGESSAKYYTASNLNKKIVGPNYIQLSCTFKREYPL